MKLGVKDLTYSYDGRPVLQGVSLEVQAGELLAIVGPNGSGKTTLLRAISGVLSPQSGAVYIGFSDQSWLLSKLVPRELARLLAAVEQEIHTAFDFTVWEAVSLGRLPHLHKLKPFSAHDRHMLEEAMERVGIARFAERSIYSLSSGERQRVFLAMALAQEPKILLLDEPIAHLDLKYQLEIMELIGSLADQGLAVVAALHDLNFAARYADRVAVLSQGQLVACGPPRQVLTEELIYKVWGVETHVLENSEGFLIIPVAADRNELGTP